MTSEEEWLERVQSWRASGVSAAEYCQGTGFSAGSLRSWSSRFGREGKVPRSRLGRRAVKDAATPSVRFARVVTAGAQPEARLQTQWTPPALVVAVGETRIEVSAGFDPSLLRAVVSALDGGGR
jgi:transposase